MYCSCYSKHECRCNSRICRQVEFDVLRCNSSVSTNNRFLQVVSEDAARVHCSINDGVGDVGGWRARGGGRLELVADVQESGVLSGRDAGGGAGAAEGAEQLHQGDGMWKS